VTFRWTLLLAIFLALGTVPTGALADIAQGINQVRAKGCENRPGVKTPFKQSKGLNEVAREWSRGGRLRDAIKRTDYRIVTSSSMHVQGTSDESAILRTLLENYCEIIVDETFTQIGTHRNQNETWVVVATPFSAPSPGAATEISARALQLVNAARARPRKCGKNSFAAVPPLKLDLLLHRAAMMHATDMAKHSHFEHIGTDGSRPADRATRAGYRWASVGENIAAGAPDVETVVQDWLDSPGHCSNIMSAKYQEMGIAYVSQPKSKAGIYWAQVFGTKK
jgi:uncharacterized protein YkwD